MAAFLPLLTSWAVHWSETESRDTGLCERTWMHIVQVQHQSQFSILPLMMRNSWGQRRTVVFFFFCYHPKHFHHFTNQVEVSALTHPQIMTGFLPGLLAFKFSLNLQLSAPVQHLFPCPAPTTLLMKGKPLKCCFTFVAHAAVAVSFSALWMPEGSNSRKCLSKETSLTLRSVHRCLLCPDEFPLLDLSPECVTLCASLQSF